MKCQNVGCGKKFYKERNYILHLKRCQFRDKKFKCDFPDCLKSFSFLGNLRKHKVIHQEKKLYPCTFPNCELILSSFYKYKVNL